MVLLISLLIIVVPIVEIYVILQVAEVIGGWETLALLVVEGLVGAWLVKWQGCRSSPGSDGRSTSAACPARSWSTGSSCWPPGS